MLTNKEKIKICNIIDSEGFEYTFEDYSDFSEIKDEELHRLIDNYTTASAKLSEYIGWPQFLSGKLEPEE